MLILGCTELPIALNSQTTPDSSIDCEIVDPMRVLAQELVQNAFAELAK